MIFLKQKRIGRKRIKHRFYPLRGHQNNQKNEKQIVIINKNEKKNEKKEIQKEERKITLNSVNEIDDIFATIKKDIKIKLENKNKIENKREKQINNYENRIETNEISSTYGLIKSPETKLISPEAPLERIDKATGLPVYKAHLLKVGDGGGTSLCPFDCDCCF